MAPADIDESLRSVVRARGPHDFAAALDESLFEFDEQLVQVRDRVLFDRASPFSQLAMCATLVIWGALPFVAITIYAALSQVPAELIEAAEIDGARSWNVFRDVTMPVIRPVLLILTSLSILWDFGVFTQPYLLIGQGHIVPSNYLMGIYLFEQGYVKTDFGRGAAISILMLAIIAVMSVFYVRKMVRLGDVQ